MEFVELKIIPNWFEEYMYSLGSSFESKTIEMFDKIIITADEFFSKELN